jgi:hypothetical protein
MLDNPKSPPIEPNDSARRGSRGTVLTSLVSAAKGHPLFASVGLVVVATLGGVIAARMAHGVEDTNLRVAFFCLILVLSSVFLVGVRGRLRRLVEIGVALNFLCMLFVACMLVLAPNITERLLNRVLPEGRDTNAPGGAPANPLAPPDDAPKVVLSTKQAPAETPASTATIAEKPDRPRGQRLIERPGTAIPDSCMVAFVDCLKDQETCRKERDICAGIPSP